jgi:hypothetical protein
MSTSTRFATLTLSTLMATLALVQIGTADFALAGKEQFKRVKPHVNVAPPQRGGQAGLTSKPKRIPSWTTECIIAYQAQGASEKDAIEFCLHPGDNN